MLQLLNVFFLIKAGTERARINILSGMEEWTTKTCIRFKKRTNEKDYIYFQPGGG